MGRLTSITDDERAELVHLDNEMRKIHARESLLEFTTYTFPDFRVSWHHRAMYKVFDRFAEGQLTRLIVTAPPRHGKSEAISRRLPAYLLGRDPDTRIIAASYGADLASAMNRDVQRIITSDEYRELFPDTRLSEKNIKTLSEGTWLRNSEVFEVVGRQGIYKCAGIGGPLSGRGGSILLCDDYLKDWKEAASKTIRDSQWDWYRSVFRTRAEKDARIAIAVTRWHEDDIVGRLLDLAKSDPKADQWTVINLPAIKEEPPDEFDPREPGEALWPSEFSLQELEKIKTSVGSRIFVSLYQQRPSPQEGTIIKREWWKFYTARPDDLTGWCISCDLTFKDSEKGDWCVMQVWGTLGARRYLVDQVRARMAFTEQVAALRLLAFRWPKCQAKYVEDAANGAALISLLRDKVQGLIAVRPVGSKQARLEAVAPQIEAGNVHLPDPSIAPWIGDLIEEVAAFPNGAHDDMVDSLSQALHRLSRATDIAWGEGTLGPEKVSYWREQAETDTYDECPTNQSWGPPS